MLYCLVIRSYAAFTLSGFDDLERNLTFVTTAFQVSKLKFLACSMKQAFLTLCELDNKKVILFYKLSARYLVVILTCCTMLCVCHTTPTQKLFCLYVFRQAGPPQGVDCLAP